MRAKLTTLLLLLGLVMIGWRPSPAQNGPGDSEGLYAPPDISQMGRWKAPAQDDRPADAYLRVASGGEKPAAKPRRESAFADRSPRLAKRAEAASATRDSDTTDSESLAAGVWPFGLMGNLVLAALTALAATVTVVFFLQRRAAARRSAPPGALILGMAQARAATRIPYRQDEQAPRRRRAA